MNPYIDKAIGCLSRPRRILLVDDERTIQEPVTIIADRLGCEVVSAYTGIQALQILMDPEEKIDLVMLDLRLPDMDGSDVFCQIKSDPIAVIRPRLPVAILSGKLDMESIEELKQYGFCVYVAKPEHLNSAYIGEMLSAFGLIAPLAKEERCLCRN